MSECGCGGSLARPFCCAAAVARLRPHAVGTSGPALLDWHNEHIARVVSASYSWNNLGVTAINAAGEVVTVDGKRCLRGMQFDLDVANEYAFDLDETVTLKLDIPEPAGNRLFVAWDKSDGLGHEPVTLPDAPEQAAYVVTLSLPAPSSPIAATTAPTS